MLTVDISSVSISPSIPVTITAGETVNLQCLVDIFPHPLPGSIPTPKFEWFHGQTPLTSTTLHNGNTYSSTLQLTSVSVSDGGLYTCRLRGSHRTAASTTVTVGPGECIVSLLSVFHYAAYMTCKYYISQICMVLSRCLYNLYSAEDDEMTTDNLSTNCSRATEIGTTTTVIFAVMTTIILCLIVTLVVVIIVILCRTKRSVRL